MKVRDEQHLREICLGVLNACNLQAIIRQWAEALPLITEGRDDEGYRLHPANILFMSQISNVMRVNTDCIGSVDQPATRTEPSKDLFRAAYEWAKGEK